MTYTTSREAIEEAASELLASMFALTHYEVLSRNLSGPDNAKSFGRLERLTLARVDREFITVATLARQNDEVHGGLKGIPARSPGARVGDLVVAGRTGPLTAREACNKVIHANKRNYQPGQHRSDHPTHEKLIAAHIPVGRLYPRPIAILEGKKDKVPWKAEVDVALWLYAVSRYSKTSKR